MSRDMKYSGNGYFGLVPNSWNVTQLKRLCGRITDGSHFSPKTVSDGEKYITVSNVYDDEIHLNEASEISTADFELLQNTGCQPKQGDVLLAKDGTVGRTAIVNDNNFVVLSSLGILSPGVKYRSLYLKRLLDSDALQAQMKNKMKGSALQRITISVIQNLTGTCPSLEEQDAIISYMEPKCASIDSAISKHQQIIEKLEEYRKAVITQAVTKGLNPNVEMKDSRDLIIGNIPMDWKCIPLKRLLSNCENNMRVGPFGSSLPSSVFQDEGPWVYNQRCVLDNNFATTDVHIPKWKFEEMKSFEVYPGDMLITTRGTIGKVAIVPQNSEKGILHPCLIRFRLNDSEVLNTYVQYIFNGTDIVMNQIKQASGSTTIEALYSSPLRSIKLPIPSVKEQQQIVSWLDNRCEKIVETIKQHNQLISKLQEYKQSLIYNAVTGKIDCTTEANA